MGVLTSAVFLPTTIGVGASGAIFGLFGAAWADLIQNWESYKERKNGLTMLCELIFGTILNFLLGLCPILDQFAHLGGMITGVLLGFKFMLHKSYDSSGKEKAIQKSQRYLQICGLVTVPVSMIILLIILYRVAGTSSNWCTVCSAINCIPIQGLWNCDNSGCSSDPGVHGNFFFQNKTLEVFCPITTFGKVVYTTLNHPATTQDVVSTCQALCFS